MFYILKMMGGEKFKITEGEFRKLAGVDGKVYIKSCDSIINMSSVEAIFPEHSADMIIDRKSQQLGILHDGTRVRRHFGQWVVMGDDVIDDRGGYQPVKLDLKYYPEVAYDLVPTIEEFEKLKDFSPDDRLKFILGKETPKQLENNGFKQIGEIMN